MHISSYYHYKKHVIVPRFDGIIYVIAIKVKMLQSEFEMHQRTRNPVASEKAAIARSEVAEQIEARFPDR